MPEEEILLHRRPPQVEPAVGEADFFAGELCGPRLEDRRLGLIQNLEIAAHHLDRPGGELRVGGSLGAGADGAADEHDPLRADGPGGGERGGGALGADHDLRAPPAVAEIEEDHPLVVADPVDPPAQGHFPTEIVRSQLTAGVTSKHARNLSWTDRGGRAANEAMPRKTQDYAIGPPRSAREPLARRRDCVGRPKK